MSPMLNLDAQTVRLICYAWLVVAVLVHIAMFFVTAPFGRHSSQKWGPTVNNRLAWVIMESPSLLIMVLFLVFGAHSFDSYAWVLFCFWILHYTNRTIVYPLRIRPTPKRMPLLVMLMAVCFNLVNAGLNGYYLSTIAPASDYTAAWLMSPHFLLGALLFIGGLAVNWASDTTLINLRKPGETGYKIPQGFLFNLVASPNLFGELVEWCGFALMAWNLPAFTFMVWTFANLVPRAKNHFDWYRKNFPDYPKNRKVIIPYIF